MSLASTAVNEATAIEGQDIFGVQPEIEGFTSGLFNTELFENISPQMMASLNAQPKQIDPNQLQFGGKTPDQLPRQFDTRFLEGFPEEDKKDWFFQYDDGTWTGILGYPLDQAKCGSCWAFATSTQFSDVIRFNLMKKFGNELAPRMSIFFQPSFICTGNSTLNETSTGVVNTNLVTIYGEQVYHSASPYFTVSFAPKIISSGSGFNIDNKCTAALTEWQATIKTEGRAPQDLHQILAKNFAGCMGCQGNLIILPLNMFVDTGGALNTDFSLHDWACLWGSPSITQRFCSPEYLDGSFTRPPPPLYKADYYSYIVDGSGKGSSLNGNYLYSLDPSTNKYTIPPSLTKQGIRNMEDLMMMSIYYYGPITIGFTVYPSFLEFYAKQGNEQKIYTRRQFDQDVKTAQATGKKYQSLGGHAVEIVGWGEDTKVTPVLRYWVVKNSWGRKWADGGFFRIQRGMDAGSPSLKVNFEHEFGSLYFAPNPIKNNTQTNEFKNFIMSQPLAHAPTSRTDRELKQEFLTYMTEQCGCRCGSHFNKDTQKCESKNNIMSATIGALTNLAGAAPIDKCKEAKKNYILLIILFVLLFIGLTLYFVKPKKN